MGKFQNKVGKVMGEYKAGDLKSGGVKPVKDRTQAIAIALSEARKATGTNPYPMGMNNLNSKFGPQIQKMPMPQGPMKIGMPENESPNLGRESQNYDPNERSFAALRSAVRRRKAL